MVDKMISRARLHDLTAVGRCGLAAARRLGASSSRPCSYDVVASTI
jgi:hypothetical protein